jgi:uncharacterized protein (TIGR02217 family)
VAFIETPRFPRTISYGIVGGPEYRTDVVVLDSGGEQRNVRWSRPRAKYTLEMPVNTADRDTLIGLFRSAKGKAHGFRLHDWSDYVCTIANGRLAVPSSTTSGAIVGSANGQGVPVSQLAKYYVYGTQEEYRAIRKPLFNTAIQYFRGGVLQTVGGGAGNYSLDTTTGLLSSVADSSSSVVSISVAASAVVTLAGALSGLAIGGRLYLTGITGTMSTVLNGLAHPVTNVSSNVYTISTSTVGLTYVSGGTGFKYAQPTETLTWAGQFDVPCRFDTDYLGLTGEAPNFDRAQSITLIEIRT